MNQKGLGQTKFEFASNSVNNLSANNTIQDTHLDDEFAPATIQSSKDEILEHEKRLSEIETKYDVQTIWRKFQ